MYSGELDEAVRYDLIEPSVWAELNAERSAAPSSKRVEGAQLLVLKNENKEPLFCTGRGARGLEVGEMLDVGESVVDGRGVWMETPGGAGGFREGAV